VDFLADFALQNKAVIIKVHLFGVIISFGAVLVADIYLGKLIKKLSASTQEIRTLSNFSKIIWLGLTIIVPTGILLFLSDAQTYFHAPKFMVKMIVVFVVIINGILLNILVSPKLESIPFRNFILSNETSTKIARRFMFGLGAISTVSWWTALILGFIKVSPAPFPVLLGIYCLFLIIAVMLSQIIEKAISSKKLSLNL
jgi:hypothetical protein